VYHYRYTTIVANCDMSVSLALH